MPEPVIPEQVFTDAANAHQANVPVTRHNHWDETRDWIARNLPFRRAVASAYAAGQAARDAEVEHLRQHILDIDAHATPYGDIPDEPGWVGTYLVTAGALHRALGKIGHTAPNCQAEEHLAALKQAYEASQEYRHAAENKLAEIVRAQLAAGQAAAHNSGGEWEYGVRWPAEEFDEQPGEIDGWYASAEDALSWIEDRQVGLLIRRRVGPVEAVTADTEGQCG